jgi:hypothetical protein
MPSVDDLKNSIKLYKKVNCPSYSNLRKDDLLAFIEANRIPIVPATKKPKQPKKTFNIRKSTQDKLKKLENKKTFNIRQSTQDKLKKLENKKNKQMLDEMKSIDEEMKRLLNLYSSAQDI